MCMLKVPACSVLWAAAAALPLAAHPAHSSMAEVDLVRDEAGGGRVEVALRVEAAPFEDAVQAYTGSSVTLDDAPAVVGEACAAYLSSCFEVRASLPCGPRASPLSAELVWFGVEPAGVDVWLYFEMHLPTSPDGGAYDLEIRNRVLLDGFPHQENLTRCTDGAVLRVYCFTVVRDLWARFALGVSLLRAAGVSNGVPARGPPPVWASGCSGGSSLVD